jgi:hypothetical protein
MSVSIYYIASRSAALSQMEQDAIKSILKKHSVNDQIETYLNTGQGLNWESFSLYESASKSGAILEGATKLPDNTDDAIWTGVQHWCAVLTELRRSIPNAHWRVTVDDHEIGWDDSGQLFDPSV